MYHYYQMTRLYQHYHQYQLQKFPMNQMFHYFQNKYHPIQKFLKTQMTQMFRLNQLNQKFLMSH
jgi:hypothetical protein